MIKTQKLDKICLGDIAEEISERIDNPSKSGYEHFIGLEHFVSGDLKIKQWGSTQNLVSAMKRFKKGDVLFARRNAYLKRASIADFDGICSGDALVIRENNNKVVPGFLAFIFNSESLWQYANSHAAGTMSKRVKWRDLAKYSLRIPSLDDQKRIADLLWSIDDAGEKYIGMGNVIDKTFWSFFESLMSGFRKVKLGEVLIPKKTQSIYPHKHDKYLGMEHIDSGAFVSSRFGNSEQAKANTFIFEEGNLLYGKLRPYLDKCVISAFSGVCSTEILVYDVKKEFSKDLVLFYMHSPKFVNYVSSRGYGTKMPRVSHEIISEYAISMPLGKEQGTILSKLKNLRKASADAKESIVNCKAIKKQIINQIFG